MAVGDDKKITPYTILSNDNPSVAITHVVLNSNNYEEWARGMQIALRAKQKLGFINGTIKEPEVGSSDHDSWWAINAMIVTWIFCSISEELRPTMSCPDIAKEPWDDLKQRFSINNGAKLYQLKADLIESKQKDSESIMTYFGRLKKFWDEIHECDALPRCKCTGCKCDLLKVLNTRREEERIRDFLMGLDSAYATIRSQILAMDPLPNLNQIYSRLI
ncbi:hypothetical protein vseg_008023 [Gypsophila vaccaria]